ncbi:hypothetical protein SAMN05421874_101458 [Nonomuraea maritima]|uniref:Vegetative cell wall protein gp1 n=1 Tax=Nonomuraea maritima TaxID=683260 RepID=A0A1G8SUU9_9ACTN|nr:hypothetical protein [Nonomuraea maritima]SDJ32961.1 hypothetical protein SAMN05421874_101458 [Nonomuraea maritima]
MTGFLAELGKKVAERWVALLVLPGLVFTAVAAAALVLGQRDWADTALLWRRLLALTAAAGAQQDGPLRTVVVLVGLLVAATAGAFVARALGRPVEHLLSGRWPFFARRAARALTERRRGKWRRLDREYRDALDGGDHPRLGELAEARNAVALTEPRCPTWIGDRLHAPARRTSKQYGLDLTAAWPRLWLLLPDSAREPLTESRRRLDEATVLGGWAVLYAALGVVWWPSAVIGLVVGLVAWRRSRDAAEVYAELVEATVDVYLHELLERFDDETRPVRPARGKTVSERFRKST